MQANSLRTSGHAAFSLQFHIIFVTKYRHPSLTAEMLAQMHTQLKRVCRSWRCELLEFNGEADHVHLLVDGHPAVNLSRLIGNLKTVSARYCRANFATHLARFYWKNVFWASAYGAFTVGSADVETVLAYIRNQEAPA